MKKFTNLFLVAILLGCSFLFLACKNDKEKEDPEEHITTLDTKYTDELKLEASVTGKDFVKDGIGVVQLVRVVDGDTLTIRIGSGETANVRFLGIDTPESTGNIQPWGKAASAFAKEKLLNASSVVLEAEGNRLDTNGRYLAWVWYKTTSQDDYRLLNLEEVEMAYTKYTLADTKYGEIFKKANNRTKTSGLGVFGQKDPDYNYSKDVVVTTLLNMKLHHDQFQTGTKFSVTVRLVRTVGNNMFLEDAEEVTVEDSNGEYVTGKGGFYAFYGYKVAFYRQYKIGDVFTLTCQLEWQGQYGTQLTGLTNPSKRDATLSGLPEIPTIDATTLTQGGADLATYEGHVVHLTHLICDNIRESDSNGTTYYTVTFKNASGQEIDVYFSNNIITRWRVNDLFTVGKQYEIIGGVAYYEYANGHYQLSMGDAPRYNQGVMNEDDAPRLNDVKEMN